ncbi:hypothetical protein HanIR_Chr03g0123491 [Helianthus annuus]|nr:hypothetical protein HanIR_Chr03g0123491 [Helianthus annuus]
MKYNCRVLRVKILMKFFGRVLKLVIKQLMDVKCCSITTTDKPNTDDYLKTAEDKLCCSIYCCVLSTAEDSSTALSKTDHL